jgi:hypothetical protein
VTIITIYNGKEGGVEVALYHGKLTEATKEAIAEEHQAIYNREPEDHEQEANQIFFTEAEPDTDSSDLRFMEVW